MAGSPAAALKFTVRRRPTVLVAPSAATPRELKLLSDIDDHESLRIHVPAILFYRRTESTASRDPARVLRDAIARALVHYYPLAGRLREVEGGKLAVDCTGEGVLFTEADADARLEHFGEPLLPPFPCLDELLYDVPGSSDIVGAPILLLQVTRLACGGFVVAARVNHTMADGLGMLQFGAAVAELARGAMATAPTVRPVWRREILMARDPPRPSFPHREYDDVAGTDDTVTSLDGLAHSCFLFAPRDVAALRERLDDDPGLRSRATTFDVLAGCLWRCRTAALAPAADDEMRLMCAVNVRGVRSATAEGGIPAGYYGNAAVCPVAVSAAGALCANPPSYAVGLVRKAKEEVGMEYIRSAADLVALRGRDPISFVRTFVISDVRKAARDADLDVGWGRPVYAGPPEVSGVVPWVATFFVSVTNPKGEEEGIAVPVCLPGPAMERFVEEMGQLLGRPLLDVAARRQPRSAL